MARAPLMLACLLAAAAPASGTEPTIPGVENPARARIDYMLKCQGCHQPDGTGNAVNTPPLKNEVARFLSVEGGRAFLVQVPGVASVDLGDERLAEVLNWTLHRFDSAHLPKGFRPYTAAEVARLRRTPLRLDRVERRNQLVSRFPE
ncbi:MAG: c-type cytochrome [Polymorphobacter sp.]|uniref:c-type cytochrome n=1 Tax=Polymorphobacter sp. TaxID=1909290 RepID=UPI003A875A57